MMTRTRQIAAVDSQMRDKALNRPSPAAYPPYGGYNPRPSLLYRLRSSNAPRALLSGCGSMREFCSSVQSITNDINNLLVSIENILPIVATYLSLPPAKDPDPAPLSSRPPAMATAEPTETTPMLQSPASNTLPSNCPPTNPATNNAMPKLRPEDIQQLLNNPLVKNLMANILPQQPPMAPPTE